MHFLFFISCRNGRLCCYLPQFRSSCHNFPKPNSIFVGSNLFQNIFSKDYTVQSVTKRISLRYHGVRH